MSHIALAHHYWNQHIAKGDVVIDATCGNGLDSEAIIQILHARGHGQLICIDRQEVAIANTKNRIQNSSVSCSFFLLCHSEIDTIPMIQPPSLIVYNLGYLPKGDKTITTQCSTTLTSIEKSKNLLPVGGALSITCYPGHEEGAREEKVILEWSQNLSRENWNVCYHQWVNRKRAPSLFWIYRI